MELGGPVVGSRDATRMLRRRVVLGGPDHHQTAGQVAEGVKSCRSIVELARSVDVDMPICDGVHAILYEGWGPQEMVRALMSRSRKSERV